MQMGEPIEPTHRTTLDLTSTSAVPNALNGPATAIAIAVAGSGLRSTLGLLLRNLSETIRNPHSIARNADHLFSMALNVGLREQLDLRRGNVPNPHSLRCQLLLGDLERALPDERGDDARIIL